MTYITGRPERAPAFEEIEPGSATVVETLAVPLADGVGGDRRPHRLVEVREYRGG